MPKNIHLQHRLYRNETANNNSSISKCKLAVASLVATLHTRTFLSVLYEQCVHAFWLKVRNLDNTIENLVGYIETTANWQVSWFVLCICENSNQLIETIA